jgi:hypothetical protein
VAISAVDTTRPPVTFLNQGKSHALDCSNSHFGFGFGFGLGLGLGAAR